MALRQSGWFKDRSSNLAAASAESAVSAWVSLSLPSNTHIIHGAHHVRMRFFGAGTAAQTITARIYGVDKTSGFREDPSLVQEYHLFDLTQIVATLGTGTGIAGGIVTATDKFFDGLAETDKASVLLAAVNGSAGANDTGGIVVYNSTANDVGELVIAGCGGIWGLTIKYTTINTTNVNALLNVVWDDA